MAPNGEPDINRDDDTNESNRSRSVATYPVIW